MRLIALLAAGASLLAIIRAIGLGPVEGAEYFTDAITRAIIAFWTTSNVTSGLAVGLLVGQVALPSHLSFARWHIVAALTVMMLSQHGLVAGAVGAVALFGAAVFASRARDEHTGTEVLGY